MNEVEKYINKLNKAERKILILEDMVENDTRKLYMANIELEHKNKELNQITYIASHDLQEPLLTVISFVELLERQYKGRLDENADQYIHFITESAKRMRLLVKDLLDFSRIGNEKVLTDVDCNTILKDIIKDNQDLITEAKTHITYPTLPIIRGSEVGLRQLFQNLISNAVKFRNPDIIPKIKISFTKKHDHFQFEIQDNGIGIDPKYKDKVFLIFQRLHTSDQYKGTGIGLATCKKVVEHHDGTIWLESTPGNGSTFYFTIPN